MKIKLSALLCAVALCVQANAAFAQGSTASISGLLQTLSPSLSSIPVPGYGSLGGISLSTLNSVPGIGQIGSLPVVGGITVGQGLILLQSIALAP